MARSGAKTGGLPAFALLLLLVLCGFFRAGAQESTGTIRGVVADKDASPLPGVTVVITNEKLGVKDLGTVTDVAGNYRIPNLAPGKYEMVVSFPTFGTYKIIVEVEAGRTVRQDITLRPDSELREVVEVVGKSDAVELEDTETKTEFDSTFISGLPLVGRDYRDILVLAPGVNDEDGDGNVNILGSRDRDVQYSVDGVSVNDPFTGADPIDINLEAIGEVELVTAGAGADQGGKSGGFVNFTTKSGTNDFEGSFQFFLRTSELDGDGAGTDPPQLHGGLGEAEGLRNIDFDEFRPFLSLGGAIIQDKLWYYVANEYLNIDVPVNSVSQVFVTNYDAYQEFAKLTWQASSAIKPALSLQYVPEFFGNAGLDSLTPLENGFDLEAQRSILTLEIPYVLSPRLLLETSLSMDNGYFEQTPITPPDLNRNGIQYRFPVDPSVDLQDLNRDGFVDDTEDSGRFFPPTTRDLGEDFNSNGIVDPAPEGSGQPGLCILDGLGTLRCEGDDPNSIPRTFGNGDGILAPADRDQLFDFNLNRWSGPYFIDYKDLERDRQSLRSTLSQEIDEFFGTHTIKVGGTAEAEKFHRDLFQRPSLGVFRSGGGTGALAGGLITASVAAPSHVSNLQADSDFYGMFVDDKYKPVPNLSIGLGVRFDRSEINASGYSHFDPAREREVYERVGTQINSPPAGTSAQGLITQDRLLNSNQRMAYNQTLIQGAVNQFTAHRLADQFDSDNTFIQQRLRVREQNEGVDPNAQVFENFQITNNNLSPRLSVSWDPWANGKTKMFGTWGRYFDRLFLSAATWELLPSIVARDYVFDADLVDEDGLFNRGFGSKLTIAAPSTTLLDRRLQDPHSDELSLGFEREIAPEFTVGLTYVSRKWQDQLQDQDINHRIVHDEDINGFLSCNSDGSECVNARDSLPDIYIRNFFFNQVLLLGNINSSSYDGYELKLTRRQHRNWQMTASYTYSEATGAAEDFNQEEGNDPTITENEFGFLDFDRSHVVKFSATTFLKKDFQLGGSVEWGSGYPWSVIRRVRSNDDVGFVTFRRRYPTGLRNDQRNDQTYQFNVDVKKSFVIGKVNAAAKFTIENLLNTDDLRVMEINETADLNQVDGERLFGRRYELGLQLNF